MSPKNITCTPNHPTTWEVCVSFFGKHWTVWFFTSFPSPVFRDLFILLLSASYYGVRLGVLFLVTPDTICKSMVISIFLFNIYFSPRLQGLGFCSLLEQRWTVYRKYLINIYGKKEGKNGVKDWARREGRGKREGNWGSWDPVPGQLDPYVSAPCSCLGHKGVDFPEGYSLCN